MDYIERHFETLDWVTLILVGCFVVLAITKYLYPKRFDEFIMLPLTNKYFLLQGKNETILHPFNVLLFVMHLGIVSLFIYLFYKELSNENPFLFLQIFTGYTVFILFKLIVEKMIGTIFSIETLINQHIYHKLSYRNFFSLLFFIGNIIFYFIVQPSVKTLIIFASSIVFLNIISFFYSYKTYKVNILANFFYFILYLCALEISPFIILYKTLV